MMKTLIGVNNAKLKATGKKHGQRIGSFGLQAGKTCPFAGACKQVCYARKGAYRYSNVVKCQVDRRSATVKSWFVKRMVDEIGKLRLTAVRWHDSGDVYSPAYLNKMIEIAKACPDVLFYAYTCSVEWVKAANLPDNLHFIFSTASKQAHLIDRDHDKHAQIFDTVGALKQAGYADASKDDLTFLKADKIGLVKH